MKNYWREIQKTRRELKEGKFECLMCDHVEESLIYLVSRNGAFCRKCGVGLYYWPNNQTIDFLFNNNLLSNLEETLTQ